MEYFRMHPSHQLSIQRKRPGRERPRIVDRTTATYRQMQQRLCDQRQPPAEYGHRGDGHRAAGRTPQQPQSKQQQQQRGLRKHHGGAERAGFPVRKDGNRRGSAGQQQHAGGKEQQQQQQQQPPAAPPPAE
eukprot:55503-Eustigmatos_ZCMA.PRE.1